ncbi:EAL domain-containing protein [Pseudoduganella sp. DS3]|uniref:EAL domain-containing protein n=1 Tax=Pseudoduganella guangdongensis TaxID=2692179 RepID=A0A6N9HQG0_9BURK|nr:EAL domain-containing protein [Pseudoduganella guangdongensis]MYN05666.1 EAL domain-containing protein [Pseudoduganella guangdongensis]
MKDFSASTALIVEDSTVQREHVIGLLRQIGFGQVLSANDGINALRTLEQHGMPVDLVLTDLDMPGMDGVELIQQLAKRRLAANLIAASANQPRLQEAARSLPGDCAMRLLATIAKPVRLEALQALLNTAPMLALADLEQADAAGGASAADIEQALAEGQFFPLYAPRVALDSGRLLGIAVQGRWRHPQRGLLDSAAILPALAGDTELAGSVVLALVRQAAADLRGWQEMGLASIKLSLPLPAELLDDLGELGRLVAGIQSQELKPASVSWEISEAVVAACKADALHNIGRISLRGYGIGAVHCGRYEARTRDFACFPLSDITIDPLFVHEAAQRSHRRPLLEGLLAMAGKLGVPVCADGIEKLEDWTLMRELGCSAGQGPLVGEPMPAGQFVAWFKENRERLRNCASTRLSDVAPPAAGAA